MSLKVRTMSLKFGVVLTLVVVFVCSNRTCCAVLGDVKDVGVVQGGGKLYLGASVDDAERIFEKKDAALEVPQTTSKNGLIEESRKKKNQNQKGFMERLLPMMIIPFMVSTSMIPMMLVSLKFMILKSAFIGKIAILLMLLNMFRRRSNGEGGVFNHNVNDNDVSMDHYGYHGDEEYGAYVNRRRRRREAFFT